MTLRKILTLFRYGKYESTKDDYPCRAEFAYVVDGHLFSREKDALDYQRLHAPKHQVLLARKYDDNNYDILPTKL